MVFRSSEYQVTFIQEDETRCEELANRYNAPIFQGDGTKQEGLLRTEPHKIDVPEECVVAAVIREEEFVVPPGSTEIAAGDHVVFVEPPKPVQETQEVFVAETQSA